jgi:FHS family glucose/mannose:H+ symporter-like MFS transporter
MSTTVVKNRATSAAALTLASCVSFVPIGIATVLLGPMLPTLSARWSLNYSQAGALFTAQYVASTCAVAVSGLVVASRGYRFAIQSGLVLMATGLAFMLEGSAIFGIICISAYGAGLGIAVPAANLLVAEVNPDRRSASLNWLNFCWSAGAVSCPFLVSFAARTQHLPLLLKSVAVFSVCIAAGLGLMGADIAEPEKDSAPQPKIIPLIRGRLLMFLVLAALFFLYVGTENAFGGWVASYAKSLGQSQLSTSLMTPSFFYAALMIGRLVAPFLLRHLKETHLAEGGVLFACIGAAGLVFSHTLAGVLESACITGFGLSSVYPITIALLSREFGSSSSRLGSFMFVLSNIGGGLLPWIVGLSATQFGTLTAGLSVPLIGCAAMFSLFLLGWSRASHQG